MTARRRLPKTFLAVVWVSAAMLFLEMVLIRWVAAEVRIFAYMHNLLLIACFFGIGLGCFRSTAPPAWPSSLAALAALVFLVADPLRWGIGEIVTQGLAAAQDTVIWFVDTQREMHLVIPLILAAIELTLLITLLAILVLQPYGQLLGAWLSASAQPVAAYSANLIGSLMGVWSYFALAAAFTGPTVWLAMAGLMTVPLLAWSPAVRWPVRLMRQLALLAPVLLVALSVAVTEKKGITTIWSPYQKLDIQRLYLPAPAEKPGLRGDASGWIVRVNNVGYQAMLNLSESFRARRPDIYSADNRVHYDLPYQVLQPPSRVLVVGAGTGNDVAAALRHGAKQVDAVDIDPVIMDLGRRLHPERPYQSAAVRSIVADARSYFKQAPTAAYDLVWFGLLDSHTTASGYSTLRLDHYVYTVESFREARRLLNKTGCLVCIFDTRRPWISDRIFNLLRQAFDGVKPLSLRVPANAYAGWGGEIFIVATPDVLARVEAAFLSDPKLAEYLKQHATRHSGSVRLATDDWPYLYLPSAQVPSAYWVVSLIVLTVFLLLRRRFLGGKTIAWPFFFLGAAFLLLEVLGVSRAALLLGNTWVVTAVVISGVLVMALLANVWVAGSRSQSRLAPLTGIAASGLLLACLPLEQLAVLPTAFRVVAVGIFVSIPLYFSGLLFTRLYRTTPDPRRAFGSNLFGAIAGGLCEQLSFIFGIRALTFFAIGLYLLAVASARGKTKV